MDENRFQLADGSEYQPRETVESGRSGWNRPRWRNCLLLSLPLAALGLLLPDLLASFMTCEHCRGLPATEVWPSTPATVPLRAAPGERPWFLSENLAQCAVTVERNGKPVLNLDFVDGHFVDRSLPHWNWVGLVETELTVPGKTSWPWLPHRHHNKAVPACVWVHPVDGARLVVSCPLQQGVEKGVGYLHFMKSATAHPSVNVGVRIDGAEVASHKMKGAPGKVMEFEIAVKSRSQGSQESRKPQTGLAEIPSVDDAKGSGGGFVSFVVEAPKKGKNHVCIDVLFHPPEVTEGNRGKDAE